MSELAVPRRRWPRRAGFMVLGAVLLVVFGVVWVGVRAGMVAGELDQVVSLAARTQTSVEERDFTALRASAAELERHASAAESLSADPIWRVAEVIPVVGENLGAVRIVSREVASLARDVVVPLVDLSAQAADDPAPGLAALASATPRLSIAADRLAGAAASLAAIDTAEILPPVAQGVTTLGDAARTVAPRVADLSDLSGVLPGMLDSSQPKTLLLMIQNNAELRTGGGITGAFALLTLVDGQVTIERQFDSADFPWRSAPIADVPATTTALYGDVVSRFVQNTTMTSDFSTSAELAIKWVAEQSNGSTPDTVDAVISIDPIVLQSLLAATGPAVLPDGSEINADNIVQRLLVEPYLSMDADGQTAFFSEVTAAALEQLPLALNNPFSMLEAFAAPATEGRISIWSARADEQEKLAHTSLGGPAARQRAAGGDAYAVYFNDATGGKMGTFMDTTIGVGTADCRPDGRQMVSVSVRVHSSVPSDAGVTFPISMTGGGLWGAASGDIGMNIAVSAPPGTYFAGVSLDGEPVLSQNAVDGGLPVSVMRLNLQPDEANTVVFDFIAAKPGPSTPVILHTPMVSEPVVESISTACF